MLWNILSSYLSGMPQDFESNSIKDAEGIMQAWADDKKIWGNTGNHPAKIGKLQFHWTNWNGIDTCTAFFSRNGKQLTFMKIARKEQSEKVIYGFAEKNK